MTDDVRERMRRIRDADQRENIRGYSTDPWGRHRLENQRGEGTPIERANAPRVLTIEQVDGKWWANDRTIGPFDTARDLEIAVRGHSNLSGDRRDWRDDAPRPSE
jgi:hypothetical protein